MRTAHRTRRPLAAAVALVAAALAALATVLCCGRAERPFNLVIIGVDTLRPDHLGCYGYARNTSPSIDRLAERGALFLDAVSQAPWTLPSFGSLFTSLYPHQQGVTERVSVIRDTFPTLATILRENGYATGAIVNTWMLNPELGLSRGFDYYSAPGTTLRSADGSTGDALAWIDAQEGAPFMLFVHYFEPHLPYEPPAPYDTLYDPTYKGRIGKAFVLRDQFPEVKGVNFDQLRSATPEDWNHIKALYDGEIAFTDAAIGDLVDGLDERGLLERTMVVLVADHGEEFYEHQGIGHGHSLFSEVIKVPLILSLPRIIPKNVKIAQQVRLIDVMPTALDILGIKAESHMEGVSLVPLLNGGGETAQGEGCLFPPRLAYSEGLLHGPQQASLSAYPWKLICNLATGQERLFNLRDDPGEQRPLTGGKPTAHEDLADALFKGLFALSDTWYVEIAAGTSDEAFDVSIAAKQDVSGDAAYLYRFMDAAGHIVPAESVAACEISENVLRLRNIKPAGRLTLAFDLQSPTAAAISFDLRINGRAVPGRVFVGEPAGNPDSIPFVLETKTFGVPEQRPDPPYFLIWRVQGSSVSERLAPLTSEAKRGLRALGYIQ
jgi:arylsulfatase A-like enzyme